MTERLYFVDTVGAGAEIDEFVAALGGSKEDAPPNSMRGSSLPIAGPLKQT